MAFRVMARKVLHRGAELISSDGVAFYELIKTALDARSAKVDIDIVIQLSHDAYLSHLQYLQATQLANHSAASSRAWCGTSVIRRICGPRIGGDVQ